MARVTLFADIAGRVAHDTAYNERFTVGCVAISTGSLPAARAHVQPALPKWRDAKANDVERAVSIVEECAVAVSLVHFDKAHPNWRRFCSDGDALRQWLSPDGHSKLQYMKPPNVAKFV